MRQILALVTLLAALQTSGCQTLSGTAKRSFTEDGEFRAWFAYYYKDPKPAELRAAVDYMAAHRYLEEYPDIASIFLGNVMKGHPDHLAAWNEEFASLDAKAWNVIVISFWLVDTDAARELARRGIAKAEESSRERLTAMLARNPSELDLLKFDAQEPRHINLLWAAFSATGDTRYIDKVISYVHLYGSEDRPAAATLGEAAIMTLATNALQHEAVARISGEAQQNHPNPRTRALLAAMITALAQIAAEDGATPAH